VARHIRTAEAGAGPRPPGAPVGTLLLAATPIGDVRQVSPALRDAVSRADVIAAEDTRKFADLCRRADLTATAPVVSFFDGNEADRTEELLAQLLAGASVVVVSDAGMPLVSDPGFRLVSACIEAGVPVSAVPGPSAVVTALAVSGLPADRFCFEGFLPRKPGGRRARLAELRAEERTQVFFEAPHRLAAFLADAQAILGPARRAVICRELTKTHQEVRRGTLQELAQWATAEVRGEVTVVIAGAARPTVDPAAAVEQVRTLIAQGQPRPAAVADVAARHGLDRRQLYDAVLRA
jgi:16S rRNA (cytidine1402-2'-O)-methyltransferase